MSCTYKKPRDMDFMLAWQQVTGGEYCLPPFRGTVCRFTAVPVRPGCPLPVA